MLKPNSNYFGVMSYQPTVEFYLRMALEGTEFMECVVIVVVHARALMRMNDVRAIAEEDIRSSRLLLRNELRLLCACTHQQRNIPPYELFFCGKRLEQRKTI